MTTLELESLSHPARMTAVARLGRLAAAGDADALARLTSLGQDPEAWRRWLSVLGSSAGGFFPALVPFLTDRSTLVRRAAWSALARRGPDPLLAAMLARHADSPLAPRVAGSALLRGNMPAVEALVARRAAADEVAWIDVLPYGSANLVQSQLSRLEARGSEVTWQRIARWHPRLVAEQLVAKLVPGRPVDARLQWRAAAVLPTLAAEDPDAALDVVEALFAVEGQASTIRASLQVLAQRRPIRTFDLIRKRQAMGLPAPLSGLFSLVKFWRAERLVDAASGVERLCWALTRAPACLPDDSEGRAWLQRLDAAHRREVVAHYLRAGRSDYGAFIFAFAEPGPERDVAFTRWRTAAQNAQGVIGTHRLDALPWDLREREARHHLDTLPWLQSRPVERRPYARLLPWAEAERRLAPWIGHPEGTERAAAWAVWIGAVRHDRSAGPLALAAVRRKKNEQDPVRLAMLTALGAVSRARVPDAALPEVVGVVDEALAAADLSPATARAAQVLAATVLGRDPTAGVALLARILQVRGSLDGHALGPRLTVADTARLDPVLADTLSRWCAQDRAIAVLSVLMGLQTRLRRMPATLDAIDDLARSPHLPVLALLLDLLRKYGGARFGRRVVALFQDDPSVVCLPVVARYLAHKRTDLIDPLLDAAPMTGRFASGRTHWVLDFGLDLGGFTPEQQSRYAAGLNALLDADRDVPTCSWAITRLAALKFVPPDRLLRYVADPRQPVRDIVLRALPYLDGGEGLPALLECMGDDRARVASYALRKALDSLSSKQVFEVLTQVPLTRVTVAKEVFRLMGERGGLAARDHLIGVGATRLHRDVRIALLRALWDHIEFPPAFKLLEAAASDPDPVLVQRLLSIPMNRLSESADTRLCGLFGEVLGRKEPEARLGFLAEVGAAPLRDERRVLFQRLLAHLDTPDPAEAAQALAAVLTRMYPAEAVAVADRILGALNEGRLPHVAALLDRLIPMLNSWSPQPHRALADRLLPGLLAQVHTTVYALQVATRVRDTNTIATLLLDLGRHQRLHHDLIEAAKALPVSAPATLYARLADAPDPRLRRVALAALVRAAGPKDGWTPEWRLALRKLQQDVSAEVSAAAVWVFPPAA